MTRVTMGDVWDDTKGFVAREAALLFPLSFATLGLATLLFGMAVPEGAPVPAAPAAGGASIQIAAAAGTPALGLWVLVLVPVVLLVLAGNLAITTLALRPGGSVGEALAGAFRRLGGALLASVLIGAGMAAALLLCGIVVTMLALAMGGGQALAARLLITAMFPLLLWISVRLLPVLPLLAVTPPTLRVVPLLRRALALTRRRSGPIAGAAALYVLGSLLVTLAMQFALGSVFLLIGRATGLPGLGATLTALTSAVVGSVLQGVWIVFQAMLYRRLVAE